MVHPFADRKKEASSKAVPGSRRGQFEIMAEILLYCRKPKAKTRIMFGTNLSFTQVRSNLELLESRGLLLLEDGKYVTTAKGVAFAQAFAGIYDLMFDKSYDSFDSLRRVGENSL